MEERKGLFYYKERSNEGLVVAVFSEDFDEERFFVLPPELLKAKQQSLIKKKEETADEAQVNVWKADSAMAVRAAMDRLSPYFWKNTPPFPRSPEHPLWQWVNAAPLLCQTKYYPHGVHPAPLNSDIAYRAIEQIALAISSHTLSELPVELAEIIHADALRMQAYTQSLKNEEERRIATTPKRGESDPPQWSPMSHRKDRS